MVRTRRPTAAANSRTLLDLFHPLPTLVDADRTRASSTNWPRQRFALRDRHDPTPAVAHRADLAELPVMSLETVVHLFSPPDFRKVPRFQFHALPTR
jgi:hypothetical protein